MTKTLILIIVLTLSGPGGLQAAICCAVPGTRMPGTGYEVGDQLPEIVAVDVDGTVRSTSQFVGSFVLIDFCTAWCEPCRQMAPDAGRVEEALNDAGVPLVYLQGMFESVTGTPSGQVDAEFWRDALAVDRDVIILHASAEPESDLETAFAGLNTSVVPTLVFLSPEGTILQIDTGFRSPEQLVQDVANLAGIPLPPLPPPRPVAPLPSTSEPQIVSDAELTISVGGLSASVSPFFFDPELGLGFDFLGTDLPFNHLQASLESNIESGEFEAWNLTFIEIDKNPVLVEHDEMITLKIAPIWLDGCTSLNSTTGVLAVYNVMFEPIDPGAPAIPVLIDLDTVSIGPFSLDAAGVDPDLDVIGIGIQMGTLVSHSPSISVDPLAGEIDVPPGDSVLLEAVASGANLSFRWQRDGVDLIDGNGIEGSSTENLSIDPVTIEADGYYGVRVEDGCRTVHSGYLRVDVTALIGDVNRDGLINLLDIQPFIDLVSSGGFQAEADINDDGAVNLLDIEPFIEILNG